MKRFAVVALVLVTVACARLPVQRQPDLDVDIPEQWTGGVGVEGEVPQDWWTAFNDPALNALIEEAFEHNHDLAAAAARVDAAAAQARVEEAPKGTDRDEAQAALSASRARKERLDKIIAAREARATESE